MKRKIVPWTTHEHERFVRLVAQGKTNRQISDVVAGRSFCAIRSRVKEYRLRTPSPVDGPKIVAPKIERISNADVPAWYDLGWRFVGFSGGTCKMEWVSSKPERRPMTVKMLEAA